MNLAGGELVVLVIALFTLIVPIWAIIDIVRRPQWQWDNANKSRTMWLALMIGGIVLFNIAFFLGLYYLMVTQGRLKAQSKLGRGPGFPGGR